MIKAETSEGSITLAINGKLDDLVAESLYIIRTVYQSLNGSNKEASEEYKEFVSENINLAFVSDEDIPKINGDDKADKTDKDDKADEPSDDNGINPEIFKNPKHFKELVDSEAEMFSAIHKRYKRLKSETSEVIAEEFKRYVIEFVEMAFMDTNELGELVDKTIDNFCDVLIAACADKKPADK